MSGEPDAIRLRRDTADPEETESADTAGERTVEVSQDFRLGANPKLATLFDDQFFTTSSIDDLQPGPVQREFESGQRVYVYAALHSPMRQTVHISWFGPDGQRILPSSYHDVEMNMAPPGYRLYTYRSFRDTGDYRVAIYNNVNGELGSATFRIE